jgi:hypothetical protein
MSSKKKIRAKNLRTWNRRGFNVRPAGWFTVLNPAGWFAASRLPGGFRYLGGEPKRREPTFEPMQDQADSQETNLRLQTIEPGAHDHPLMRPALVVLGAIAITSLLLWWVAFPHLH